MTEKVQLRQQNQDETDKMAQFESPNGEAVCASYISRKVADQLGEFAELLIDEDADVEAALDKTTTNYAVYETPGGSVTGLYINRDLLDGEEAPESVGLQFAESDEETFEEAAEELEEAEEEEADDLLADSDDSEEDDEEEVEITDEELDLVDAE